MLFYALVEEFKRLLPEEQPVKKDFKEIGDRIFSYLDKTFEHLAMCADGILRQKMMSVYEKDSIYSIEGPPAFYVRLRPNQEYYSGDLSILPYPLDPEGCDAAGLEVGIKIYFDVCLQQPVIRLEFKVQGKREFTAFRELFSNYRRMLAILCKKGDFRYDLDGSMEKLEDYRGGDICKILDIYFGREDDDSSFTLSYQCREQDSLGDIMIAFFILFAIFDSSYHYVKPRRNLDRILDYYYKLS